MTIPGSSSAFAASARVQIVGSLHALVTAPFVDGINALCWPRVLPGDFREVVEALPTGEGIVPLDEGQLASLALIGAGKMACDILLADIKSLRAYDHTAVTSNLSDMHYSQDE